MGEMSRSTPHREEPIHCVCGRVVAFTDPTLLARLDALTKAVAAAHKFSGDVLLFAQHPADPRDADWSALGNEAARVKLDMFNALADSEVEVG